MMGSTYRRNQLKRINIPGLENVLITYSVKFLELNEFFDKVKVGELIENAEGIRSVFAEYRLYRRMLSF